ncbi:3-deoxy-D-manno-octulosonic acid transferase [Chitinophaga rhizophila]|uniref:3-deoxy-D-manno-octulosonic acid transferase n=1 Tax=Chitinophaga rhizophila TaxID=2866212 RepID=A0ABS7GAL2_9BACT|nr:glycosyltransferase N-terminal domain-containing protein [Chitinophaga rhizophila]MBW8684391.1 3-deoxy-D-manno-octulosonic acid transferase [Chitinophaga rhizophila]
MPASTILYDLGIRGYRTAVTLAAATGNAKARRWIAGRQDWRQSLQQHLPAGGPIVWVHAASLGEFEQGRPVLEAIRREYPNCRILLTFFSPSGYEVRKDYPGADHVCYLPLDTRQNALDFIKIVQPALAIFIKYEFWYHMLTALYKSSIPVLLVSGIFRPGQLFFKPYGGMFRRLLQRLTAIFVQNSESLTLLQRAGLSNASLTGDTRFDRVWALQEENRVVPAISEFVGNQQVIVAGSTWKEDEALLAAWWHKQQDNNTCLIIAPHEVEPAHISQLMEMFPEAVRYTEWVQHQGRKGRVLLIDNVGMLSALYRYATITYVGGGFGKEGIHNILEPATYGKPVVFGPIFDKFPEAAALIETGGGISVEDQAGLDTQLSILLNNKAQCMKAGAQARQYVVDNKGATEKVLGYIQEKRFLTRL